MPCFLLNFIAFPYFCFYDRERERETHTERGRARPLANTRTRSQKEKTKREQERGEETFSCSSYGSIARARARFKRVEKLPTETRAVFSLRVLYAPSLVLLGAHSLLEMEEGTT